VIAVICGQCSENSEFCLVMQGWWKVTYFKEKHEKIIEL